MIFAMLAVASIAFVAAPAHAGKPGSAPLTGTIELVGPARVAATDTAWPAYGDAVDFRTTVSGTVGPKTTIYVNVVCLQGSTVVFQSSGPQGTTFTLADQAGQGLEWNGAAADCIGSLVVREEKGRNVTISYIAQQGFAVA
jgi:hypothetical protein